MKLNLHWEEESKTDCMVLRMGPCQQPWMTVVRFHQDHLEMQTGWVLIGGMACTGTQGSGGCRCADRAVHSQLDVL